MKIRRAIFTFLILFTAAQIYALEPAQILVIANKDMPASVRIAEYYCARRNVPRDNILSLPLGTILNDAITRDSYEKKLAEPIRQKLSSPEFAGKIKCLLTTYGVPYKVGGRGPLKEHTAKLKQLENQLEQQKSRIAQLEQSDSSDSARQKKQLTRKLPYLQVGIDYITGRETNASVDSELSMVLFDSYQLYRWQLNNLKNKVRNRDSKTLMVCRLDGPSAKIAGRLIDKAIRAEKTGLKGVAYFDSRGKKESKKSNSFGYFDQSLRDLAILTKSRTGLAVKEERTEKLFEPGQCPRTAIYCGWYSLKNYIDAFDFIDGAIGYHISSWEAVELRDPAGTQWCTAMLREGITATLGAVAEPYLHAFPQPKEFFEQLFKGSCLVEAYYHTKPFNSWQLLLIGDPLYTPFKKPQTPADENLSLK